MRNILQNETTSKSCLGLEKCETVNSANCKDHRCSDTEDESSIQYAYYKVIHIESTDSATRSLRKPTVGRNLSPTTMP